MKLFITYILIFMAACLAAQSIEDEILINKVDLFNKDNKFSVVGDTTVTDQIKIYSEGEFRASLDTDSGAYLQEADKRNQKDIRVLKDGSLYKLLQLEPISYLMKNQGNRNRSIGLVAQDVRTVFPALVQYIDGEDVLALSYIELIPILIKAIQEQQRTIENLKQNQYSMQKEFAVFRQQMAHLTESLTDDETIFRNDMAAVAENQNSKSISEKSIDNKP